MACDVDRAMGIENDDHPVGREPIFTVIPLIFQANITVEAVNALRILLQLTGSDLAVAIPNLTEL